MILHLLRKYLTRYFNIRFVFLLDLLVSFTASGVTLYVADQMSVGTEITIGTSMAWLGLSLLFSFVYIWVFRTYRLIIRHMTILESSRLLVVAFFKSFSAGLVMAVLEDPSRMLYIMMMTDFLFTFFAFLLLRLIMLIAYDIVLEYVEDRRKCQNVLVYGVGERSVSLIARLQNSEHYQIVGFLQYGEAEDSHVIGDKTVYYVADEECFTKVFVEAEADALLFAAEEDARAEKDRLIKYAIHNRVRVLFVPSIDEIKDGKLAYSVRNIQIEDLLMRQEIEISMSDIVETFRSKTVLVTGAAGSIGSELCRQLASLEVQKLILFDNAETPMHNLRLELEEKYPDLDFVPVIGDVRRRSRLDFVFDNWRPQIVFHAAAYKHVPLMEENPCEAVLVNVAGSRNVADKCMQYDVEKMVMVSTDKAVNPTNVMGCTKRLAEIYVQSLGLAIEVGKLKAHTRYITTRFGNVLGSNGSVIPRFREQIAAGGPVTVTHPDITRFFMTIPEACRLVMEAATMSKGNQIFVFDMGERIKIDDLARNMIRLAGYVPDKDIKVEYSGLRPGEKLYEEVLSDCENTVPTEHSRIHIAKVREYDYSSASYYVNELEYHAEREDVPGLIKLMKQVVPEYVSKNSRFEIFDK